MEENTPAEQEVALDPELLGKVFENLLAAYNPETRESARKQTGSYYTPRAVVDYMVDEALTGVAGPEGATIDDGNIDLVARDRLHYLFDYNDAGELFERNRNGAESSVPLPNSACWTRPWAPAPSPWASCTSSPWPSAGWTPIT